jgi:glycosyltransferase involved in cell wall biosynthesis
VTLVGNIKKDKSVIAIIPAYNEDRNIKEIIEKSKNYVHKIIVVDDGSEDNTLQIAKSTGVLTIANKQNRGKAKALKQGFGKGLKENGSIFVILDGDGQHNPDKIPLFLEKIYEGFDLVIGARKFDKELMPRLRIMANWVSSYLVSFLCGIRIEDSQSGYRAIKRSLLENITFSSNRFQIDTEMIVKAAKCGFKIGFLPIKTIYHPEAKSKVHQIIDPLKFIILLIQLAFWKCHLGKCRTNQ